MGYVLHLFVAILALGIADAGFGAEGRAPWAVAGLALVPYALAWSANRASLRGRFRSSERIQRVLAGAAPAMHAIAVLALGWTESVRDWFGSGVSLSEWPRLGVFLSLAPFVVYELAAIDARARIGGGTRKERRAWRLFQVRMLLSGIVPLVFYVLIVAAVGTSERIRVELEEVSFFGAAFAGAMLFVLALSLPWLLRSVLDTAPMPEGTQRDVLASVAERTGFRARALLVWNTGDLMANAAIVGIGPRSRVVLFSDSLLTQLDASELAAVFAHEIGHAVRKHVLAFVAWAGGFFLLADWLASHALPDGPWFTGTALVAAFAGWFLVFGYVSRRCELEADLYCIESLGDPWPLVRALEKVGGRFRDVAGWRHFSTADRVRFLAEASTDPQVGGRLRRTLRRWNRSGLGLLLVAASLQVFALSRSYASERLTADLRLGRFRTAGAWAASVRDRDPGLAALADQAASIGKNGVEVAEIEGHARAALAAGDLEAGLAWLELGAYRGSEAMLEVAREIHRMVDSGEDPRDRLPEPVLDAWSAELATCRRALEGPRSADPPGDQ